MVVGPPSDAGAVERAPRRRARWAGAGGHSEEGVVEEAVGDGAAGRDGQAGRAVLVGGALVDRVAQRARQPAQLRVVAGHRPAPVVLVEIGQLVVEVHGALEELGQREVPGARTRGRRRAAPALPWRTPSSAAGTRVAGVVVRELLDAAGGVVEAQAQADEGQAGAEEERQRDAGRQQRVPGGEALLRERGVVGLVVPRAVALQVMAPRGPTGGALGCCGPAGASPSALGEPGATPGRLPLAQVSSQPRPGP